MSKMADEAALRRARTHLAGAIHDRISTLKGEGNNGTEVVAIAFTSQGSRTSIVLSRRAASELRRQLTELGVD